MANDSPMSSAILVAALRIAIPDLRRIRARLLAIASQSERGAIDRVADADGACALYEAMATARELSQHGERRIAQVQSTLYHNATSQLRRSFQRAYDRGAVAARPTNDAPTPATLLVNGRPSCCADAATHEATIWDDGTHWAITSSLPSRIRINFCPFCGTRLPEVPQ